MKTMKLASMLLFASCLALSAETQEQINKRFTVQPGGKLVLDVDFGSIDIRTNATSEVVVDVFRKVSRGSKADEEAFLAERPVTFSQDGHAVTVYSRAQSKESKSSRGQQRTEAKYTITLPAQFSAQLKTSGGGITVTDLTGDLKAATSGGALKFTRLHGPLDGRTAGGGIRVADCQGTLKVNTSGGDIDVSASSGTLEGDTSGGSVAVKEFHGPVQVETSGGDITIENVVGKIEGSTSGGFISAKFSSPLAEELKLKTSGGAVTLGVPENSQFDLDAATSGGSVSSQLPVSVNGKPSGSRLKGPVNGGGKSVVLRSGGGSIQVRKL